MLQIKSSERIIFAFKSNITSFPASQKNPSSLRDCSEHTGLIFSACTRLKHGVFPCSTWSTGHSKQFLVLFPAFSGWTGFLFHGDREMQGVLTSPLSHGFLRLETGPNWNILMDCGVKHGLFLVLYGLLELLNQHKNTFPDLAPTEVAFYKERVLISCPPPCLWPPSGRFLCWPQGNSFLVTKTQQNGFQPAQCLLSPRTKSSSLAGAEGWKTSRSERIDIWTKKGLEGRKWSFWSGSAGVCVRGSLAHVLCSAVSVLFIFCSKICRGNANTSISGCPTFPTAIPCFQSLLISLS